MKNKRLVISVCAVLLTAPANAQYFMDLREARRAVAELQEVRKARAAGHCPIILGMSIDSPTSFFQRVGLSVYRYCVIQDGSGLIDHYTITLDDGRVCGMSERSCENGEPQVPASARATIRANMISRLLTDHEISCLVNLSPTYLDAKASGRCPRILITKVPPYQQDSPSKGVRILTGCGASVRTEWEYAVDRLYGQVVDQWTSLPVETAAMLELRQALLRAKRPAELTQEETARLAEQSPRMLKAKAAGYCPTLPRVEYVGAEELMFVPRFDCGGVEATFQDRIVVNTLSGEVRNAVTMELYETEDLRRVRARLLAGAQQRLLEASKIAVERCPAR